MTEPLSALIADDEPLVREALRNAFRRIGGVHLVAEARDGHEALAYLAAEDVDVAFLDIRMPGFDGFELLERVPPDRLPAIVFVTAWEQYALRAFQARALDYVLKPIDDARLAAALERARTHIRGERSSMMEQRMAELLRDARHPSSDFECLAVRLHTRDVPVEIRSIEWVEGDRNYVRIVANGRRYPARETMNSIERRLTPYGFLRIHRSTLVNLARVREIVRNGSGRTVAVLVDGTRLRVSAAGRRRLAARWNRLR